MALAALDPSATSSKHDAPDVHLPVSSPSAVARLATIAQRAIRAERVVVTLASEYFSRCPSNPMIEVATFDRSVSPAASVMMSGQPLIVSDAVKDAQFRGLRQPPGTVAFAGVPIFSALGVVIGVLSVRESRERHFTPEDLETLEMIGWFVSREVEFCDLCTAKRNDAPPHGTLPLTGKSVLIVGPPGLSRDVMHDWLTNAGALVDATSAGTSMDEFLADAAVVGVPYSVLVLDAGLSGEAAALRKVGCTVPIVAFRSPDVPATDPQFAGCSTVLPTPIERGAHLIEACRRLAARPAD